MPSGALPDFVSILVALLYWYADKCYWETVTYNDIWLDIDIWLEIVYCLCCDILVIAYLSHDITSNPNNVSLFFQDNLSCNIFN